MRVIWGNEELVSSFVQHEIGLSRPFGACVTAAVIDNQNKPVAGFVFHNYDPGAEVIECSGAALSPRWCTRSVLGELMGYVFAHCQMVVARTAEDNHAVRRLWKALGAQEYIIPRLRGRLASEAVLCVTDDAWAKSRLNEVRHG